MTPQSQKSYTQVAGENISGAADKVFGAVQPSEDKSTSQKMGDSTRGTADDAQSNGSSYLDSAKQTVGDAGNYVSDTFSSGGESPPQKAQNFCIYELTLCFYSQ